MQRLNIPNELDHKHATTNWILVSIIFITVGINDKRLPTIANSILNLALEYAVFPVSLHAPIENSNTHVTCKSEQKCKKLCMLISDADSNKKKILNWEPIV